jgi:enoyl-CoA hydratase/carnithine racemase
MRLMARDDVIRELTYTARPFNAAEAVSFGFATRIAADPYAEAMTLARAIAERNPDAIRAAKRLINLSAGSDPAAILTAESLEQQALIGSRNQIEAVRANIERRSPDFIDP